MKVFSAMAPLQDHWRSLNPREQILIRRAALLIGLALLWWTLLAPPLRTLRQAESQQRIVELQDEQMLKLQDQAKSLQAQPKINRDDALRALEASLKQRLGASAQLNIVGDRATITLRNTPADELAQWLAQVRLTARLVPNEVRLVKSTGVLGLSSPAAPVNTANTAPIAPITPLAAWDGTLVLMLPLQ